MLLPCQNPSVEFSLVCSSLNCLLGRIPAFQPELYTLSSHSQFPLSQYLQRKMSFWKTLVLGFSYEWLFHGIEPQVGTALRDHLHSRPFLQMGKPRSRQERRLPKVIWQVSCKGDPGLLILTPPYEFIIALPLPTQWPPCPTGPVRIFASLGVVSLFLLFLSSLEMEEKIEPSGSSGRSLLRSPPWDTVLPGLAPQPPCLYLSLTTCSKHLIQVENGQRELQEEQGEHRLGTEGKGAEGMGLTDTDYPPSTRHCAGQL